jgi:MSHA biogenesis protein MshL
MVRVRDGNIVAIGGLMQMESNRSDSGMPGARDNSVTRTLFSNQSATGRKKELVVLIKPTIIRSAEEWQRSTEQEMAALDERMKAPRRVVTVNAAPSTDAAAKP